MIRGPHLCFLTITPARASPARSAWEPAAQATPPAANSASHASPSPDLRPSARRARRPPGCQGQRQPRAAAATSPLRCGNPDEGPDYSQLAAVIFCPSLRPQHPQRVLERPDSNATRQRLNLTTQPPVRLEPALRLVDQTLHRLHEPPPRQAAADQLSTAPAREHTRGPDASTIQPPSSTPPRGAAA